MKKYSQATGEPCPFCGRSDLKERDYRATRWTPRFRQHKCPHGDICAYGTRYSHLHTEPRCDGCKTALGEEVAG